MENNAVVFSDQKLLEEAKPVDGRFEVIDSSWRKQIKTIQGNVIVLPVHNIGFGVEAGFSDSAFVVWGHTGELVINKIYSDYMDMWDIVEPLIVKDFKVGIAYDLHGNYAKFVSGSNIGFHHFGMHINGAYSLCVGRYRGNRNKDMSDYADVKLCCKEVFTGLSVINMSSLTSSWSAGEHWLAEYEGWLDEWEDNWWEEHQGELMSKYYDDESYEDDEFYRGDNDMPERALDNRDEEFFNMLKEKGRIKKKEKLNL